MQNSFNFRLIFLPLCVLMINQAKSIGMAGLGNTFSAEYGQYNFTNAPCKFLGAVHGEKDQLDSVVDKTHQTEISNLRIASPLDNCVEVVELSETEFLYVYSCDGDFIIPEEYDEASVLIVAGGGGGGYGKGAGGGGGGGVAYVPTMDLERGAVYWVTVGRGGQGAPSANNRGGNGENSEFNGNGNGAAAGGGGGGANGNGNNGQGSRGGNGGAGRSVDILDGLNGIGIDNVFAAGGGGSGSNSGQGNNHGDGGSNKGGNGSNSRGGNGAANTGSGGGAGWDKGGNGADGIVIIRMSMRILSVQWQDFSSSYDKRNRTVNLDWSFSSGEQVAYFEVERSLGGVEEFKSVARLNASEKLEGISNYQFKDNSLPASGGRVYFRIKEVRITGEESYSSIVAVQVPPLKYREKVWKAYPNPTNGDDIKVELANGEGYSGEEITVKLISSTYGVQQAVADDELGLTNILPEMMFQSAKGLWVMEISWGDQVEYIKVLKR